jgi:hypothetical protein
MQALWNRWASSVPDNNVHRADPVETSYNVFGKSSWKHQHITYMTDDSDTIAKITRFWFDDGNTEDLIFIFRWAGDENVLADW